MALRVSCPPVGDLTFSIAPTAAAYSALAGVLAGFAFAAIILVIPGTFRRDNDNSGAGSAFPRAGDAHVLVSLLIAFIGLIISTLQYAQLAGEGRCAEILGRAADEEVLSGITLAFAILTLLYAIAQLLEHARVGAASNQFRTITAVVVPALALYLVGAAVVDASFSPWLLVDGTFHQESGGFVHEATILSYILPVVLFIGCALMWRIARWLDARVIYTVPLSVVGTKIWLLTFSPYLSLVLIISAAIGSATITDTEAGGQISHSTVVAAFGVCAFALFVQSGTLQFLRTTPPLAPRAEAAPHPELPSNRPPSQQARPERAESH